MIIKIILVSVVLIYFMWLIRGVINPKPDVIQKDCTCGRHEKCKSKIVYTATSNGVSVKREDFWKCGKFWDEIEKMDDLVKNGKIKIEP